MFLFKSTTDDHQELDLHAKARMSSLSQLDDLKDRYNIAWQVPGLPQLLLLSNVSGKLFQKHKQEHPEGYTRPWEVVGNNREAHPERANDALSSSPFKASPRQRGKN